MHPPPLPPSHVPVFMGHFEFTYIFLTYNFIFSYILVADRRLTDYMRIYASLHLFIHPSSLFVYPSIYPFINLTVCINQAMNQAINQSSNQATNQEINHQYINQTINSLIHPPTHQSMHSFIHSFSHICPHLSIQVPINQIYRFIYQSFQQSIYTFTEPSIHTCINLSIPSIGISSNIYSSMNTILQSIHQLIRQFMHLSTTLPIHQSS